MDDDTPGVAEREEPTEESTRTGGTGHEGESGNGHRPGRAPPTWLDTVEQLLDETVDREEQFELVAEDLRVEVPLLAGEDTPRAEWGFDGTVSVDVKGLRGPLAEWLQLWEDRHADDGER